MDDKEGEVLRQKRTIARGKATKLIKELASCDKSEEDELALRIHHLEKHVEFMDGLQSELDKLGVADDSSHVQDMSDAVFKAKRVLSRLEREPVVDAVHHCQRKDFKLEIKLPKFSGEVEQWPEFWNLFRVAVHENKRCTPVERFVHLKSYLIGKAHASVQGLPLTDGGYVRAIETLKERFDRPDLLREAVMQRLLNTARVQNDSDLPQLRQMVDRLVSDVRSLETMGVMPDSFAVLLMPILKLCVPESWRLAWMRAQSNSSVSEDSLPDFIKFLQKEMRMREESAIRKMPASRESQPSHLGPAKSAVSVLGVQRRTNRSDWVCGACHVGKHGLAACSVYRGMDVASRWRMVRQEGLCYQCLGPHMMRMCTSSSCPRCGGPHHSSLHDPGLSATAAHQPPMTAASAAARAPPYAARAPPPASRAPHSAARDCGLPPAAARPLPAAAGPPVWSAPVPFQAGQMPFQTGVHAAAPSSAERDLPRVSAAAGPPGWPVAAAAAVEEQPPRSQVTSPGEGKRRYNVHVQSNCFVQTVLVEACGPRGVRQVRALIDGGSDTSFIRSSLAEQLGLEIVGEGTFACVGFQERTEEARVYSQVQVKLVGRQSGEATLVFWKTDRLCVPVGRKCVPDALSLPEGVTLADDFREGPVDLLIGCDQIYDVVKWDQLEVGPGLRLIETVFGHVLHGQAQGPPTEQRHVYRCQLTDAERMWDLDSVGIAVKDAAAERPPEPTWNPEERRYEMSLLWKSDNRPVSNLPSAAQRTDRMAAKMSEEELYRYDRHLTEMIMDNVVEDAPPSDDPAAAFYLPHRGIVRNDKLRVVFDGSAPDATGRSLNEYLDPGENLLRRLPSVLLNFRASAVGCQADIRAAFHQIVLKEEDRRFVQFLWRDHHLRFRRVPFGVTCSPYMLLRTVCCHVRQCLLSQPQLMQKVQNALYMDDICPAFSSREEAVSGMEQISDVFSQAGMELHKTRMTGDVSEEAKVLGLTWDTGTDRLAVTVPEMSCPRTRRELLSAVAKPFDPLGLLTPWLIAGKELFQRTWTEALSWDDQLPAALQAEVAAWWRDSTSKTVWFPRAASTGEIGPDAEYHVFCDASKVAYCAAIYVSQGGESRLLIAKARLAPLKPALTIPRLELMAAVVGCRLMQFVCESLNLCEPRVTYWTDATDVLYWLSGKRLLRVFVQNRVTSILQMSRSDQWRHVRGGENPADLGTRGVSVTALVKSDMWWHGPQFLQDGPTGALPLVLAPTSDELEPSPEAERELKSKVPHNAEVTPRHGGEETEPLRVCRESGVERESPICQAVTRQPAVQADVLFDITSSSDLKTAVNKTAWILRFVHNVRSRGAERWTGPLSPEERRTALHFWIREAQLRAFSEELQAVRNQVLLPVSSPLARCNPCVDENGLLCAVPRTNEPPLIVLPEWAHVTVLIVDEGHRRSFHQGTRVTLALLSAEYFVRRRTVRRVVETCRRCRRYRGLPYRAADGALPTFRAWRSRRRVCDRLIRRWTTEYLQTLRCWSESPRGRPVRLPAVGEIVLVQGEGRRGTWPLARVETLIPGPDGRCRAAFIRVRGRLTRRPISRLFRLEASPE